MFYEFKNKDVSRNMPYWKMVGREFYLFRRCMKEIKFATQIEYASAPKSAIKYLPDWYKKTMPYAVEKKIIKNSEKTFKHCIPFMEGFTIGYIAELWADIQVENDNGVRIHHESSEIPFGMKSLSSSGLMKPPPGYDEQIWSYHHDLYIKTPPGYSILVTHPFNRYDLPFLALTGVVDSDTEPFFPGAYPMYLKTGFEGIIESGTPMLQIIPFKRDSWKSVNDESIIKPGRIANSKAINSIRHWYKKNAWVSKKYE